MPFEIVRNDITNMQVDAIVNTANPRPVIGSGVDARIHEKAGPELLKARRQIGNIPRGQAAISPAYGLQARWVIHTVGPAWQDGAHGEAELLYNCYAGSLKLAQEKGCESIAFPFISTGNYGFPKDLALQIAIQAFSDFLLVHEMRIYLVVFDRVSYRLSERLFQGVASFIDENYVDAYGQTRTAWEDRSSRLYEYRQRVIRRAPAAAEPPCAPAADGGAASLEELLKQADAGFTETLLKLIDQTGKKDSEIYKRANISKQHFSKIRNNPDYHPTKSTAIALALALELDLNATRDLIGRAGYALTNSSKFDLIIRYFIERKNYNVVEINMALYDFDQTLLGA